MPKIVAPWSVVYIGEDFPHGVLCETDYGGATYELGSRERMTKGAAMYSAQYCQDERGRYVPVPLPWGGAVDADHMDSYGEHAFFASDTP